MSVIKGENYFVTAINLAPKDEKKFAPFADVIEIKSKAKLSEHYRILAEVLNEIRKQDETSWVWNKAKLELSYLSKVVERNLAEFNVEGWGKAMISDSSACMNLCNLICGFIFSFFCASIGGGWMGALICALGSAFICEGGCAQICRENPTLFSGGCSGGCNFICDQLFCKKLGTGRAICQTHICPFACSGACAFVQ